MGNTYGFKKDNISNKGKHFSEEHKEKIGAAQRGVPRPYARLNPHLWKKGKPPNETSFKKGHISLIKSKGTKIELIIQKGLTNLGILFTPHKRIIGTPDIFIEPNLCIFADGFYWHTKPKDRKHDKIVNNELISRGYIVLRFLEGRINYNIDKVISTILLNIPYANRSWFKREEIIIKSLRNLQFYY